MLRQQSLDDGRHVGHGCGVQGGGNRQIDAEELAHMGDHAGRAERVPAQLEEFVVNPDLVDVENLGPDAGERLLDRIAGRGIGTVQERTGPPQER